MSGGHFDYDQYKIGKIADWVEDEILRTHVWEPVWEQETVERFKEAVLTLRRAQIMAHRIDWLLSGDDGEETFAVRWQADLDKLERGNQ